MAQTREGALRVAAGRIGVSPDEYAERIANGEKHCRRCRRWKGIIEFHVDNSRADGRASACKDCRGVDDPYTSTRGRPSAFRGKTHTEHAKQKMSAARKGNKQRLGKKHTPETCAKISRITRERTPRGEKHPAYKGGLAERSKSDRRKAEYQDWRKAVFSRDNYTCQNCGDDRGGNLRAHHIKPFADYPELRFEVSNGKTLCHTCHELEHFKPDSIRNQRRLKRGERLWK